MHLVPPWPKNEGWQHERAKIAVLRDAEISNKRCHRVKHVLEERTGGGSGNPKVCAPKVAQINISFCKLHLFPLWNPGPRGGGGVPLLLRLSAALIHP